MAQGLISVTKFQSDTTGRKLVVLYEDGIAVRYSLTGRYNFRTYGTITEPAEIDHLRQWVEGFGKIK